MYILQSKLIPYIIFLPLICGFSYSAITVYQQQYNNDPKMTIQQLRSIKDPQSSAAQAIRLLLKIFNVEHNDSFKSIVDQTQKHFLRPPGKERWQLEDYSVNYTDQTYELFQSIGLIDEVVPSQTHYKYALLFGASVPAMRNRIAHMVDLFERGIRFDSIVVLSGQRPLNQERDVPFLIDVLHDLSLNPKSWPTSVDLPTTEIDMIRIVLEKTNMPQELRALPIIFANAPMNVVSDGSTRRPTTADTISTWLTMNPEPGTCLAISDQPHVGYQDAVLRLLMPSTFIVETVGARTRESNALVILDALARWLFNEYKVEQTPHKIES